MSIGSRPVAKGPKRGEIYRLSFRDIGGHVLSGQHWAVVIQTMRMAASSTTLAAPITSSAASAHLEPEYLVPVSTRDTALSWGGFVHADQIFAFPSAEFEDRAGTLPQKKLEELERALRFVLELD